MGRMGEAGLDALGCGGLLRTHKKKMDDDILKETTSIVIQPNSFISIRYKVERDRSAMILGLQEHSGSREDGISKGRKIMRDFVEEI